MTRLGAVEKALTDTEKNWLDVNSKLASVLLQKNELEMAMARQKNEFEMALSRAQNEFGIKLSGLQTGQDDCMAKHAASQLQLDALNVKIAQITAERDHLRDARDTRDTAQADTNAAQAVENVSQQAQITAQADKSAIQDAERVGLQIQVTALNEHRDADGNLTNLEESK